MKKIGFLAFLILVFGTSCLIYVPYEGPYPEPERRYEYEREYGQEFGISYFYDYLSSYGIWIYNSRYGYVWIPRQTGYRWRPYTHGRWIWTDYGWTWDSFYEWGWIPFHYGRWGFDGDFGWFWVPDTVWGPAWVTWRWSNLYIGWAPLPPGVEFVAGVGIHSLPFALPPHYWIFIEGRYFPNYYLERYVLPFERNVTIINYTIYKTNIYVRNYRVINEGIDIDEVRRITRDEISKYELQEARRPGPSKVEARKYVIYKPSLSKNEEAKPRTILSEEEAKGQISKIKLKEPEEKTTPFEEESRLRKEQEQELRLLERTQEKEISDLDRKVVDKKRLAKSSSEAQQIEKEHEVKVKELKKLHDEEKSQIQERHKKEEETVKKKKLKKSEEK